MALALGLLGMLNLYACGGSTAEPGSSGEGGSGGSAADGGASSGGASSGGSSNGSPAGGALSGENSGGAGNGTLSTPCTSPEAEIAGQETGFVRCAEGYSHRLAVRECPSVLPRDRVLPPTMGGASGLGGATSWAADQCNQDSDCPGKHAKCEVASSHDLTTHITEYWNRCSNGCTVDADCGAGAICECGEEVGTCVSATCQSDADCSGDALCVGMTYGNGGCFNNQRAFACHEATDECLVDEDCSSVIYGFGCSLTESGRVCTYDIVC